jgi:hypothetical protein
LNASKIIFEEKKYDIFYTMILSKKYLKHIDNIILPILGEKRGEIQFLIVIHFE